MVIAHRYLTRQKRDINPVPVYCGASVANGGSILKKGGGALSLFARLPLIKPYNCEGHLCSRFKKSCSIDIVT